MASVVTKVLFDMHSRVCRANRRAHRQAICEANCVAYVPIGMQRLD